MQTGELIAHYLKARDKKEELKAAYDAKAKKIDEVLTKIEGALMVRMEREGTESMKSEHGTAYISTRNSCTTADKEAFLKYIRDHNEWGLLDARPLKSAVEVFVDANDGELPPGINWRSENVLRIRRS